jgi:hypothetical protein
MGKQLLLSLSSIGYSPGWNLVIREKPKNGVVQETTVLEAFTYIFLHRPGIWIKKS